MQNDLKSNSRNITFAEAIHEATDYCMSKDPRVYILGQGASDPKGIFATTINLSKKYGIERVQDTPVAENGMTGIAIGTALTGMRPVMVHMRVEFAILAMDQIINQAAKWYYMNAGQLSVPIVIRLMIGRGWGQGAQHAQSLESLFSHIPGLKVVEPSTPADAKGLLISAIKDNNPVLFFEHRWLYDRFGPVPNEHYQVEIGKCRIANEGDDITIISHSYMVLESLRCADILKGFGIKAEVIDLRSLRPLDVNGILNSVKKTKRLLVVDTGWMKYGISAEIIAVVAEDLYTDLLSKPQRMGLEDVPCPSTRALAVKFYPRAIDIVKRVANILGKNLDTNLESLDDKTPADLPHPSFTGPF